MIDKIISFLENKEKLDIVCDEDIYNLCKINSRQETSFHIANDPRSAMFYLHGLNLMEKNRAILIVDSKNEADIITGLTEVWFQHIGCLIFIINGNGEILSKYNNRNCIHEYIELSETNYKEEINNLIGVRKKSFVFNVNCDKYEAKYEIKKDLLDYIVFNSERLEFTDDVSIPDDIKNQSISRVSEKGCISRYIGGLQDVGNKSIFLTTDYQIEKNINSFSLPYINERFKLIILKRKERLKLREWIESNSILVYEFSDDIRDLEEFFSEEKSSVLMINV